MLVSDITHFQIELKMTPVIIRSNESVILKHGEYSPARRYEQCKDTIVIDPLVREGLGGGSSSHAFRITTQSHYCVFVGVPSSHLRRITDDHWSSIIVGYSISALQSDKVLLSVPFYNSLSQLPSFK